ncbi:MAG TPA: hypothetical protein VN256_01335 [Pyrinomonadaceae bacterium]|nr:hypothetical protein [Pyrinomonadaceae bacterium]
MRRKRFGLVLLVALVFVTGVGEAAAQRRQQSEPPEFGPIVSAYLSYLENEQEVVDDRASRHEINRAYYIKNSNRIRALRQMALKIARETDNDYLPELEAAARDELGSLFETPPKVTELRVGQIYNNTFRFLGPVRSGDVYYIFARLDPYEQAELMGKEKQTKPAGEAPSQDATAADQATSRPRRVGSP